MVGLILAGPLSDWHGRKPVVLYAVMIMSTAFLTIALLPPGSVSAGVLLTLRLLIGMSTAIQKPAGLILAVESCPVRTRPHIVFGTMMLVSLGYLGESFLMLLLMPHFGEMESDNYRLFYFLMGAFAFVTLPGLRGLLCESPSFLAVKG